MSGLYSNYPQLIVNKTHNNNYYEIIYSLTTNNLSMQDIIIFSNT